VAMNFFPCCSPYPKSFLLFGIKSSQSWQIWF